MMLFYFKLETWLLFAPPFIQNSWLRACNVVEPGSHPSRTKNKDGWGKFDFIT